MSKQVTITSRKKLTDSDVYSGAIINVGGGTTVTPNLQSVTDKGSCTTNAIKLVNGTKYQELRIDSNGNFIVSGNTSNTAAHFGGDVVAFSTLSPPTQDWYANIPIDNNSLCWNGCNYFVNPSYSGGSGGISTVYWSGITGTIASNTDLQNCFNSKLGVSANAASATKLYTARSIVLGGDVTGSANFDGTASITITATVADDSHNHTIANIDNLSTCLTSLGSSISTNATNNTTLDSCKVDCSSVASSSVASSVVARDGSGDINARLFRSEYDNTNPTVNYIMTQIDTASNNYIRPTTPAQFRAAVTDGVYLTASGCAVNSAQLDGIDSSQFLRSDVADTKTAGNLTFNDSVYAGFGTSNDLKVYHSGTHSYIDNSTGNLYLRVNGSESALAAVPNSCTILYFDNSGKICTTSVGVTVAGCSCATDHIATSDCRKKCNINLYNCGLQKVNDLQPVSYTWKDTHNKDIGFIAQDVLKIEPLLVAGTEETGYGLKYEKFTTLLVKAIQELSAEVRILRKELNNLKNEKSK